MTPRQKQVMLYIERYISDNRISPTLDEIADGLGIVSRGNVHQLIKLLVRDKYLEHLPRTSRGLTILKMPGRSETFGQWCGRIAGELESLCDYSLQYDAHAWQDIFGKLEERPIRRAIFDLRKVEQVLGDTP